MLVGYARVSTSDQDTDMQIRALRRAGVRSVYEEKGSSVGRRPQLQRLLQELRPGNTVVVYKLDRMARSLRDLLGILERLESMQCGIRSLSEPIDTGSAAGRLMIQVLGAVAEFERSLIRERVVAGQEAARARGQRWGRPAQFTLQEAGVMARMWREGWGEQAQLAEYFGVSESCVRDQIHRAENRGRWLKLRLRQ